MAFDNFKSLGEVGLAFNVSVKIESFVQPIPFPVDENFRNELTFDLRHMNVRMSEASICESLIAPVVKKVWRAYADSLLLWSHIPFGTEEPLLGTPDYCFSGRSVLGLVNDQPPYVLLVEAKKDDFDGGWGQCLAAMLAAQRLNMPANPVVHGGVSNGYQWEFGRLSGQEFTRDMRSFSLFDLAGLFAAWNCVFAQAKAQALAAAA